MDRSGWMNWVAQGEKSPWLTVRVKGGVRMTAITVRMLVCSVLLVSHDACVYMYVVRRVCDLHQLNLFETCQLFIYLIVISGCALEYFADTMAVRIIVGGKL